MMLWTNIIICQVIILLRLDCLHSVEFCPMVCECSQVLRKGVTVNCSFKKLNIVPSLPSNTIRLYLQNNSLTTVKAGAFDHLQNLEEVDMSNNPWNCDCYILYLKMWLESQPQKIMQVVRCATPATISMKPFNNLTGNEIAGCRQPWPIKCIQFLYRDLILLAFALVLLLLMSCAVCIARRLACRVTVNSKHMYRNKASNNESQKSR
ncbi:platelet glycoprotein IX [Bombina bombina]|uniref:platelet glycoprotein IX n=1 Tax=Bombina bombina TaxID=8345 RepID=UPI00235AEFA4|nr:platelet glycoprotein IX [Bombina bombina]